MNPVNLKRERLKQRVTVALMTLSYIPFLIFAGLPDADADSIAIYLASQTGYAAAVMLWWQFILGTRAVSGLVHKDLIWVNKLHQRMGIYGILLVFAHPLLVAYKYSEDFLFLFFGQLETSFEKGIAFGRVAFLLFLIVWITSAVVRHKIAYRPWKYIHYLAYIIFPLVLLHAPQVGTFYAGDALFQNAWKVMIAVYVVMVALRLAQLFRLNQSPYEIIEKKEAAPDIFMYRLRPLKKKLLPAPGQFIYVRRGFWSEEHPFSVASYSAKTQEITIATKRFGKYTQKLSELPKGSRLWLDGPYGVFTQEIAVDTERPVTFIAGGIGLTPFMQHVIGSKRTDITMFNANRTKDSVIVRGLLKKSLGKRYIDIFSDKDEAGAESGRLDAGILKKYLGKAVTKQQYYVCGPPPMMKGVKALLLESGVPEDQIHTEEFSL